MPQVSIIVPIHNKEHYIGEAIRSILAQSFRDFEVICIDNDSTDDSLGIVREFASRDERVHIFQEMKKGVSFARNTGLEVARGDFISFVDADDVIDESFIQDLMDACISSNADIGVCGYDRFRGEEWEESASYRVFLPKVDRKFTMEEAGSRFIWMCNPSVCTKLFRHSLIDAIGLRFNPDYSIGEDLAFTYTFMMHSEIVAIVPKALYHYRRDIEGQASLDHNAENHGAQIYKVLKTLMNEAQRIDDGKSYIDGILIYSIEQTRYALEHAGSFDEFKDIFAEFKRNWIPRIERIELSVKEEPGMWELWRMYCDAGNAETLLLEMARKQKDVIEAISKENCRLKEELKRAQREIDLVKNSHSYKLGNGLLKMPAWIKHRSE